MYKKEKEIQHRPEIDRIIGECDILRLAMCLENKPYLLAFSFGYDGNAFYIHTAKKGRKIEYFEKSPQVCFELENKVELIKDKNLACKWTFLFQSVVGFGRIREVEAADKKLYALKKIMKQYSDQEMIYDQRVVSATKIWEIHIDEISGKVSPEYKNV